MKMTVNPENDSPGKVFIYYAVPAVLVRLIHSSAAVIDGIFVGRYIGAAELAAVNLCLNYLFIIKLSMGIKGAALATAAAQLTTFGLLVCFLLSKTDFKITLPYPDLRVLGRIFYNGLSEFSNELSAGFTAFTFNLLVISRIGNTGIAAFRVLG